MLASKRISMFKRRLGGESEAWVEQARSSVATARELVLNVDRVTPDIALSDKVSMETYEWFDIVDVQQEHPLQQW
eukprot:4496675-Amphidinium_carterae.1